MMKFNKEIIERIEININLPFIDDEYREGEVCFADSSDVRTEFRQSFSVLDVVNYIKAIEHKMEDIAIVKIPYPKDASTFWEMVEGGAKLEGDKTMKNYQNLEWH